MDSKRREDQAPYGTASHPARCMTQVGGGHWLGEDPWPRPHLPRIPCPATTSS
jgi:hypothetical protein